ncbi:single-stranded-DNA-specific exonuclease RecJ [Floccifex sp.]|uniref:single-stranded-DNA-specific exonuclease RecJ n=1 Tax=Floccifex sp. TaxID=2815810 RepID=UPI003F127A41
MENLSILSKKVLQFIEPDCSKWNQWLEHNDLEPISNSECIQNFIQIITEAKESNTKILVAGDYDCDGIMATTIMVDGLRKFGIDCGFYIPNRLKEGYGLHAHTVDLAYKKGYKIIVTVDNGIKAFDALERAEQLGITTIVTDHHTLDEFVPCDLLVHPNEMEPSFSSLCGAGVAYECIRALKVDTPFHLMCACVASIGDMMPVKDETRWIIQKGIKCLNQSHEKHFFALSKDPVLNETSIAFQIVPKLNALGRLSDVANVNNAVRYFLSDGDCTNFVCQMEQINDKRKNMSSNMTQQAIQKLDQDKDVLFVYDQNYHEGIIGLTCGQINSQFDKPCIVATSCDGICRCSMRAPLGFNCVEFLKDFPYFETMGGHKQAAGFTFVDEQIPEFEQYIEQKSQSYQWQKEEKKTLLVNSDELNLSQVKGLDVLRPFGPGFELPSFEIQSVKVKSLFDFQNGKHRKYVLENGLECMDFNQSLDHFQNKNRAISSLIGSVSISSYRKKESVNFCIDAIKYK